MDASGDVYVTGPFNQRIPKFDANGTFLTMRGSLGTGDGQFMTPREASTDGLGNILVADTGNHVFTTPKTGHVLP